MWRDPAIFYIGIIAIISVFGTYLDQWRSSNLIPMSNTFDYDLVVIGAGLAGLSAVIEAVRAQPNLKIALIEKQDRIGGNSAKASSGINAISSESDQMDFIKDTLISGLDRSNKELVQILVDKSEAAVKFLEDEHIDLSVRSQLGGHCQSRTRRNQSGPNIGFAIISALQATVQGFDQIEIKTSFRVISIKPDFADRHRISYQHGEQQEQILTRAVIVTTGGFAANPSLLSQYRPEIAHFPTTNGLWANGDGIQLAVSGYDAALIDMDQIQIHPTGFMDPADRSNGHKILAPEALRGSGGILVDAHGRRFVNELSTRDIVAGAVISAPGSHAFLILDESAVQMFGMGPMQFYMKRGLARKCSSILEITNQIALNGGDSSVETLTDTINSYRHAAVHKMDQFGKKVFPSEFRDSEFYVMEIVPVLHYCMGGLKFDTNARVLNTSNEPVPGLFAAGEVTGGLHGANRLAGNSLLECVVFGRIAASSALEYIHQK